jgi:uncharacterized protein YbjT (DUF2867 family)
MVRAAEGGRRLADLGYDVVRGDFGDEASVVSAFEGAECVFLVAPLVPELEKLEGHAIDAATSGGVRRVVKLVTAGVAQAQAGAGMVPRQYPLHQRSEERLARSGLSYTHLRPGPFMQDTLNFAPTVVAEGLFRGAWGNGRMGTSMSATSQLLRRRFSARIRTRVGPMS